MLEISYKRWFKIFRFKPRKKRENNNENIEEKKPKCLKLLNPKMSLPKYFEILEKLLHFVNKIIRHV
jgi:hypothetical protein